MDYRRKDKRKRNSSIKYKNATLRQTSATGSSFALSDQISGQDGAQMSKKARLYHPSKVIPAKS